RDRGAAAALADHDRELALVVEEAAAARSRDRPPVRRQRRRRLEEVRRRLRRREPGRVRLGDARPVVQYDVAILVAPPYGSSVDRDPRTPHLSQSSHFPSTRTALRGASREVAWIHSTQ